MLALQIAGGISLTIFGIRFLRKGMDRLFGSRLVHWLEGLTENSWRAFGAGILTGIVAPSSTALSLVTVQTLNVGGLKTERMLAVLLGTSVGFTLYAQLIAFHIHSYYAIFLIAGVVGFQFLHHELIRGIGQCLLAFGFLFLAMSLLAEAAIALQGMQEFLDVMHLLEKWPFGAVILAILFTMGLQSSTASIAMAMAVGNSTDFPGSLWGFWIIGTNIGVALTTLTLGWNTIEGRRLGSTNLLIKCAVSIPFLMLPGLFGMAMAFVPHESLSRGMAMFHTFFNISAGLLALPFLSWICRVNDLLIPSPKSDAASPAGDASYLDAQALSSPPLALAFATREVLRMADQVQEMLSGFWNAAKTRNAVLARQVQAMDDRLDAMNLLIKSYLSRIIEEMNAEERQWQFALLSYANELESAGDVIDKNLCDSLIKQSQEGTLILPEDFKVLEALEQKVAGRLKVAISLLTNRDKKIAGYFLHEKEALNEWYRETQRDHYERLREVGRSEGNSSSHFLDMLNSLRRLNSHITTIGYAI